ncbi:uncharacterized protein EI90DRAFT_2047389 [Cantharellus anzutake]|uniref:uncharacterized protein n=1 Tax=Cantharellus anzutake TaxID=1750568 RepID=UPI001905382E|nr:uncharacterized protein EI90DRAFT_2047389 [Cantharellus anzutake]KAF8340307.1 hypothetical protein EI90DRAFT_2047389 [Cantharellus anzutake]
MGRGVSCVVEIGLVVGSFPFWRLCPGNGDMGNGAAKLIIRSSNSFTLPVSKESKVVCSALLLFRPSALISPHPYFVVQTSLSPHPACYVLPASVITIDLTVAIMPPRQSFPGLIFFRFSSSCEFFAPNTLFCNFEGPISPQAQHKVLPLCTRSYYIFDSDAAVKCSCRPNLPASHHTNDGGFWLSLIGYIWFLSSPPLPRHHCRGFDSVPGPIVYRLPSTHQAIDFLFLSPSDVPPSRVTRFSNFPSIVS